MFSAQSNAEQVSRVAGGRGNAGDDFFRLTVERKEILGCKKYVNGGRSLPLTCDNKLGGRKQILYKVSSRDASL